MPRSLDGKSALIIDGLTDIGTAIALKLASEGADIALSYPYRRHLRDTAANTVAYLSLPELVTSLAES